jgi:hypothetical protein
LDHNGRLGDLFGVVAQTLSKPGILEKTMNWGVTRGK